MRATRMNSAVAVALATLIGCTSVAVRKVAPNAPNVPGIRYHLPQPCLLVSPRRDGGVDVAWKYLPDPRNQYAVEAKSVFAKYKLDIVLADGLLDKVDYNPDATTVPVKGIESAANISKAYLDAVAAKEKEGTGAKGGGNGPVSGEREAWGPVLFRVVSTPGGVSLQPALYHALGQKVAPQIPIGTSIAPIARGGGAPPAGPAAGPAAGPDVAPPEAPAVGEPAIAVEGPVLSEKEDYLLLTIRIKSSHKFPKFTAQQIAAFKLTRDKQGVADAADLEDAVLAVESPDAKTLEVKLIPKLEAGTYLLHLPIPIGGEAGATAIRFTVRK